MEKPKTLIIMRHAHAEAINDLQNDEQRKLTSAGVKQAKKVARYLFNQDLLPQKIITSPYTRSKQTAECMIKWSKKAEKSAIELEINEAIALAAPVKHFTELLNQHVESWPDVTLLVSHEPNISRYLGTLLGSKTSVYAVKKVRLGSLHCTHRSKPSWMPSLCLNSCS